MKQKTATTTPKKRIPEPLSQTDKELYRIDKRDILTPYRIIGSGITAQRFETEQEARRFYNLHDGRALLSVTKNQKIKYLAYKFS